MMKTRTIIATVSSYLFCISAAAQTPPVDPAPRTLHQTLRHALAERVPMPLAFSTRDTAFVLSLSRDEPAEVYLRLTLTRNGKVKERLTRVDANHIAAYVAPAFVAATKDLRIDRTLLTGMAGKDTALLLAFPLEYRCMDSTKGLVWQFRDRSKEFTFRNYLGSEVYDAMKNNNSVFWLNSDSYAIAPTGKTNTYNLYRRPFIQKLKREDLPYQASACIWYFVVFLADQQE